MKVNGLALIVVCYYSSALAQNDSLKSYITSRVQGEPPVVDGRLTDKAWEQIPWGGGDFIQRSPDAGKAPSAQTFFKILYDAKNLYIAVKNEDPEPEKIVSRMSRRDGFEGDFIEINIDSYFDKRTAFSFTASVSGVKGDEYVSNNGDNWDANWDPIWYLKTSITRESWIAEIRIPLSQLRFADKPEHIWGIQFTRFFFRNQERSNWQYIPPDASGWVHLFGSLRGIVGVKPQKQLEVQPYVVAKTERFQKEEGNPFATGKSSGVAMGLDAKIGITSDVTLDVSVNPDFGQVEADPSQVNLTAFRMFFQERRPFFIEGSNTLNFPITDFNSNNLFYSRRIGRTPQVIEQTDPEDEDDDVEEYAKSNKNTTILGAAKLTGKNKKGFSWGILESLTDVEKATLDSLGVKRIQTTEPTTNYFVARAQQDINKGATLVGGMFTATNRSIRDRRLTELHKDAYSGGVDVVHNWRDRTYYVSGKALMSHVLGSTQAITNTQKMSERYFQRPDNNHAGVDTTRRSLTGTGGTFVYGKRSGKLVYDMGYTWISPELELNDVGFLTQADQMTQWIWAQYRVLTPVGIFRWMRYNVIQYHGWDFDRKHTSEGYELNGNVQFNNFLEFRIGGAYQARNVSNADLRGGPALYYPGDFNSWIWLSSDARKKLAIVVNPQWRHGLKGYLDDKTLSVAITYKPINALSISVEPSLTKSKNALQYIATGTTEGEDRFVVGEISQTIARLTFRTTYMITPNLSVQYWGQPFGSAGKYSDFKYITDADAANYQNRFTTVPSNWFTLDDDEYSVDENSDNKTEYTFDKPDFNFGQFRSNLVVRWEYIPGSTLFLVWTQEMTGDFYDNQTSANKKYQFKFEDRAHNTLLMKFTYRFVL